MKASLAKGIIVSDASIRIIINAIIKEKEGLFNPDYHHYGFSISCYPTEVYISLFFHYEDGSSMMVEVVCDYDCLHCKNINDKVYVFGNIKRISLS